MNNIYFILNSLTAGLLMLVLIISCNDLEEYNPSGGETSQSIWGNPEGFQTLINAAYVNQRNMYGKEDAILMTEPGTDIWFRSEKATSYRQLIRYMDLNSTAGTVRTFWRSLWPSINYCNAGIDRIDRAGYSSELAKNQKLGELKFLRAFYYFHVVETWGGVCLRTTETNDPPLNAVRSPVEDFYNVIIDDLEFAAQWLPVTQEDYGRPCRKAAYGFLAKALLTRGYYSFDKNNEAEADEFFTEAKRIAHSVIDSAANWSVSLYPNFSDLWQNIGPESNNKTSIEALYVITNSFNSSFNFDPNGNRLHLWFMAKYNGKPGLVQDIENGNDGYTRFMPTQYLLDLFDETMDSRYAGSFQDTWYCNTDFKWNDETAKNWHKDLSVVGDSMIVGDTALYVSKHPIPDKKQRVYVVIDRDSLFLNDTIKSAINIYPSLKKYRDSNRSAANLQPGFLDIIVMRLAEVYLIAAEAEFQLGELNEAADDINVIRNRAAIPGKEADMQVTAADITLDFILDERARELAGEHMRWFDLKRTRTLVDRIQRFNKDIKIPAALLRKDNGVFENVLLRPVPQNELDALLNGEEFGQNPGY
ncbi:MAG: RagB/SusD family nutrient uptake outer membrane protein [Bacteroidales bacterium]|nr:RagB/SusD family nutrient uptake outer membrane protein [Bacteroidales bacterium]